MANMPSIIRAAGNGIRQELDASLTDSGLSVTVDDGTPFNSAGGLIEIDYDNIAKRERVYYLSKSGNVLTIADDGRGLFGTTAVAHDAGALVRVYFVDEHINNLIDDYETTITALELTEKTGWTPVSDAWTYASATTITVPAGAATYYSVGDKIKYTQTTVKYANIVGVADTVLTVTGGTDYTVADAAITDVYVSKADSPVGFPAYFNYTPTETGWTSTTIRKGWFRLNGRQCVTTVRCVGTSDATTAVLSLPITAATIADMFWGGANEYIADNNTDITTASRWVIASAGTTAAFYDNMASGGWTASSVKEVRATLSYLI